MSEVLQANIFFFIASAATIVFTILLCVLLYHVIKIIRSVRRIVERVEQGSEVLADDIEHLRSFVLEGSLISQLIRFFMGGRGARNQKSRSRRGKMQDEES